MFWQILDLDLGDFDLPNQRKITKSNKITTMYFDLRIEEGLKMGHTILRNVEVF